MASKPTNYTVYTTTDDGKTCNFLGEQEGYTRKEAIGKLLAREENAELRARVEDSANLPEEERAAFVIAPVTSFQIVKPKVETKVEVTFG